MLKQRLITGLSLLFLALCIIFFAPCQIFFGVLGFCILLAAWEWGALIPLSSVKLKIFYLLVLIAVMMIADYLPTKFVLFVGGVWWVVAFVLILLYAFFQVSIRSRWWRSLLGWFAFIPAWLAIDLIRSAQRGTGFLLLFLCIVWAADTGAFFAGSCWGKRKLLPQISPKKTWMGFFGGLMLSLVIAWIGALLLRIPAHDGYKVLILAFVVAIFSVIGDLFESMMKRQANVKDSGHYLPGHGGMLDRVDSLLAAAPIFLLGCQLMGWI